MLRARKSWTSVFESPARGRRADAGPSSQVESETPPSGEIGSAINLCVRMARHWYQDASAADWDKPKRASEDEVQAFEQRNGVKLPVDLREYFQRLNGIDVAPGFFRFWSLSRLIPLKSPSFTILAADRYFIFSDYMVGTLYYAIYLGEDPFLQNRVILPDFPSQPVIAKSFSEFVELYLTDSLKLYGSH